MDRLSEYYGNRKTATEQKIGNIIAQVNSAVSELSDYLNGKKRDNLCVMTTTKLYVDRLNHLLEEYNREEAIRSQLSDFCLSIRLRQDDQR